MVGVRACCGGADGGSCRTSFTSSTPAPRTGHTLHATLALHRHEYTSNQRRIGGEQHDDEAARRSSMRRQGDNTPGRSVPPRAMLPSPYVLLET